MLMLKLTLTPARTPHRTGEWGKQMIRAGKAVASQVCQASREQGRSFRDPYPVRCGPRVNRRRRHWACVGGGALSGAGQADESSTADHGLDSTHSSGRQVWSGGAADAPLYDPGGCYRAVCLGAGRDPSRRVPSRVRETETHRLCVGQGRPCLGRHGAGLGICGQALVRGPGRQGGAASGQQRQALSVRRLQRAAGDWERGPAREREAKGESGVELGGTGGRATRCNQPPHFFSGSRHVGDRFLSDGCGWRAGSWLLVLLLVRRAVHWCGLSSDSRQSSGCSRFD